VRGRRVGVGGSLIPSSTMLDPLSKLVVEALSDGPAKQHLMDCMYAIHTNIYYKVGTKEVPDRHGSVFRFLLCKRK
jgi:hypothetical protein